MTIPSTDNQVQEKTNDKEMNFRALEAKYQRQVEQERSARIEAERLLQDITQKRISAESEEDDESAEPYVDHKRLNKTLNKFGQNTQNEINKAMETAKKNAKEELKQEMWLENNPDFHEVLQHAERFAQRAPKLADTILRMPNTFERQQLVYQNIKELGLDKPEQKQPSIQETIDAKRRGPYYQPTSVGSAPYGNSGDFSQAGQRSAYDKMQALKNQLRI